ncbi:hypothetical protein BDW02DRAFT_571646, partial [Decorospora gaudefroyi]
MARKIDDDEYVAELLKKDARAATKKYDLVGIDAFNPRRSKSGAPKPNTNFLRHIIRQTDSHNATLLAKEAEESRARLRMMEGEQARDRNREQDRKLKKAEGRLTPVLRDEDMGEIHSRRRRDHSGDEDGHRKRRRGRERNESRSGPSRRHRDRSRDAQRHKRRRDSDGEDRSLRKRRRSKSPRDKARGQRDDDEGGRRSSRRDHKGDRHRRRRSYSRPTPSPSPPPRSDEHGTRHRHRGRSRSSRTTSTSPRQTPKSSKRPAASRASDSDPLEAIVGPLPPSAQPTVRSRGRGAHKANSMGIESRFSSTYNPSLDIHANSDLEDDWGDAVEAYRDRVHWKQQGADRLKAAGFTDEQVKKWERGDVPNEDDVVWTRKGQAREWDRGKVVDDDGHVDLKADFGRL